MGILFSIYEFSLYELFSWNELPSYMKERKVYDPINEKAGGELDIIMNYSNNVMNTT
jgi:hypothetical protein